MKLYADEHVEGVVVQKLRKEGFDVLFAAEEHRGETDREHFNRACEENRITVTRDDDFLSLASDKRHPGIIYIKGYPGIGKVFREIRSLLETYSAKELRDSVFYVPRKG